MIYNADPDKSEQRPLAQWEIVRCVFELELELSLRRVSIRR